MQEGDTSGNIIPPPSVNESEAQDKPTGNQVGEGFLTKNATYTQQKKRLKTTYEESILEIIQENVELILMKKNLSYCLRYRRSKRRMTNRNSMRRWNF